MGAQSAEKLLASLGSVPGSQAAVAGDYPLGTSSSGTRQNPKPALKTVHPGKSLSIVQIGPLRQAEFGFHPRVAVTEGRPPQLQRSSFRPAPGNSPSEAEPDRPWVMSTATDGMVCGRLLRICSIELGETGRFTKDGGAGDQSPGHFHGPKTVGNAHERVLGRPNGPSGLEYFSTPTVPASLIHKNPHCRG